MSYDLRRVPAGQQRLFHLFRAARINQRYGILEAAQQKAANLAIGRQFSKLRRLGDFEQRGVYVQFTTSRFKSG